MGTATEPTPIALEPDAPFRILVLADFSGRANRGLHGPLAGRPAIRIDCDNFDEVLERLAPALKLPGSSLRFSQLDDFHPDHLYRTLPLFEKLANLRPALPKARQAAAPVKLEDLIQQSEDRPADASDANDLAAFIERVSAAHLESKPEPGQQEWQLKVHAVVAEQMSAILHHADYQALEGAWRAVSMMVDRLGAEDGLQIYLLDATLAELTSEPEGLARLLAASKKAWGLLVANFAFGQGARDAARLAVLGHAARSCGAPILAEAMPPSDVSDEWESLRRSSAARSIGLALPRFLLRLPYGRNTSPVEALTYEEMTSSVHSQYLWGNPAFFCAILIGLAFREEGWDLRPGLVRRIDGLPQHLYTENGETSSKPCAEVLMTEHEAEELLDRGFIPVASLKDQDAALAVRFCSIANPAAPLAGRWSSAG